MKKFQFVLERVRSWRQEQVDLEKAKLRKLFDELHSYQAAIKLLDTELAGEEKAVVRAGVVDVRDLKFLESFRRYILEEKGRIAKSIADCQGRIAQQRRKLVDTQRQFRLLEKMKERQWSEWTRALGKETDDLAAEIFVSQWKEG
jgi:flagellar export protein FliJ